MTALPFLIRRLGELRLTDEAQQQTLIRQEIVTVPDLELAAAEERPSVVAPLRAAVPRIAAELPTVSLGRAWDILEPLIAAINATCPDVQALEPAGAMRRVEPLISTLTLVGRTTAPTAAVEAISRLSCFDAIVHRSRRRLIATAHGREIDVRFASPDEHGSVLFASTGPAAHVAELLKRRGVPPSASETQVYTHAGLSYVPPQLRDSADALEAAATRRIPRLIDREDMRGDLHMHTSYSDGRDSTRDMVMAALALGYEYIAITDHSEHAGASRTVSPAALVRQRDEIAALREHAAGMTILQGLEVDILPDGTLDCPDTVLEQLDIVLASLHDAAGHDRKRLTARCLAAIRHPLVSVITHPGNQLVGQRDAYDMDYDAIYAAAVETGTALEVDGAPSHLDLDGKRAREAILSGVTLVVDSDCHRAASLDRQMRMGVGTARRGWVEPRHVLNTRPVDEVLRFIARKRSG